ncbi:MAG TPA: hypothetical protein VHO69_17325, partial [Phototrophicaceae bacterium]|nr:hypothetical protein [Phototrophicaceae bacterium]
LQAVIAEQTPDLADALEHCQAAATLYDLIQQLGQRLTTFGITRLKIIRWLYGEFYRFNDEERAVVYARWLEFHQGLTKLITRFISDQDEAERTAWLVMCTLFGYGQLFFNLELRAVATFEAATMTDMLAALLSQTLPPT